MAGTPQRPRMIFDCSERLRRAIKYRAVSEGSSPSDVISKILEQALGEELKLADKSLQESPDEKPTRGRPRKQ